MNSPYMGKFAVSQQFTLGKHDGLDIYGIDSKEIHSTVNGVVHYAGWENGNNQKQGFGQYVCVRFTYNNETWYAYFGHLSKILVKTGQSVKVTDVIGVEGNTGYSFGSHCHYEIRKGFYKGAVVMNVSTFSGIPNACGTYDDGYRVGSVAVSKPKDASITELQKVLNSKGADLVVDGICGEKTLAAVKKYSIELNDKGNLTEWVQRRLTKLGFDAGYADGFAEQPTMDAVHKWQKANNLGVGNLYGSDWDVLLKGEV